MVNPLVMNPWIWDNPGPFHVGDRVRIPFGSEQVEATVVEDRGILGKGGARIYRVVFRVDDVSPEIDTERDVDEMTLVARAPEPAPKPKRKKRPRE
jgi:hypothetical protein